MAKRKADKPKPRPGETVTEELNDDDIKERDDEAARDAEDQPTDEPEEGEEVITEIVEDYDAEMAKLYPQVLPKFFQAVNEFAAEHQAIAIRNGYRQIAHDWAAFKNMAARLEKTTETDYWSSKFHEQ